MIHEDTQRNTKIIFFVFLCVSSWIRLGRLGMRCHRLEPAGQRLQAAVL